MSTTPGLEELKAIYNRTWVDGAAFAQAVKAAGYTFKEKAPWGSSVVMERGEDKFIIDIQGGGVRELVYRCESQNVTMDLVKAGMKMY